jgi:hypothetical protein
MLGAGKRALRRLVAELRSTPNGAGALARLRCSPAEGADVAIVHEGDGLRLDAMHPRSFGVVSVERGVYARIPTSAARVKLLEQARVIARDEVMVHVVVTSDSTHLGRLAIDGPRRLLKAAGARVAEAGDRFGPHEYAHAFFDEEALLGELARAGLVLVRRSGFTFTLRDARRSIAVSAPERADPFALEVARVTRVVRAIDRARKAESPRELVRAMRARGESKKARGPIGRARLRRAIGWVDALTPGGANCYRRVLLEIALDAGAARETVVFGLDVGSTGHVAFADSEDRTFDVSFAIPAD